MRIRQDGKEKVWISCLQNDVRASGIAGGWKATVLETGMRVKTVTEGGRWLISAWRKEEVDTTRHCKEKKEANEARKVIIVRGSVEPRKRHQ